MNAQMQFLLEERAPRLRVAPPAAVMDIGKHMAEFMAELKVGLADVARATGIRLSTLFDWRWGNARPVVGEDLLRLVRYFNTSVDYLCYGIGLEHPYGK